ncbi:MAG: hypothetical protein ACI8RD_013505, partial [Bacillariaceae sp.]
MKYMFRFNVSIDVTILSTVLPVGGRKQSISPTFY